MHLWFKRKTYGWGWTPANYKGWVVIVFYLLWNLWVFFDATRQSPTKTPEDVWQGALIPFFAGTVLLVAICYATGERPRWQWGGGVEKQHEKGEQIDAKKTL